jgi:hypothetical protein
VISINPQYYTPEGDIVEDEEDIDEDDEPLEENIYKDIKLEGMFKALCKAHDRSQLNSSFQRSLRP